MAGLSAQVGSIVDLLREGRCALHTRLACYKFLITYGLHFSVLNIACYWYAPSSPSIADNMLTWTHDPFVHSTRMHCLTAPTLLMHCIRCSATCAQPATSFMRLILLLQVWHHFEPNGVHLH